jgi:hypothetical protein
MQMPNLVGGDAEYEITEVPVVWESDLSDAERNRLMQAEELLRELGYLPHADGTWHPGPMAR